MSGDLISREDVLRVFYSKEPIVQGEHDGMGMLAHALWRHIREAVEAIPTVECEPVVHAHWVRLAPDQRMSPFSDRTHSCSKCGKHGYKWYDRCWSCGAVMDEKVFEPTPLARLCFGGRVTKRLKQMGVTTVEQLETMDKHTLHNIPGLGRKSIEEIETELRIWREKQNG